MSETVKNRSEILFLYDVKDSNPNGDPLDGNKPRIDEETMTNLVTDVRLKRTVRDYLDQYRRIPIFIKKSTDENGKRKTKEALLDEAGIDSAEKLLAKYIDMRMFGATAAVKENIITFTGPIQFKIGRSLHRVKLEYIKGTTVMPSKEDKTMGTFTEMYVLPYSLICFYGIVNENAAKDTGLTEEDVKILLDGLWNGTKNLITRSKVGQMPRLLLKVNYKEKNYHIGDLSALLKLESGLRGEEIRDTADYTINASPLVKALNDNRDKVKDVELAADPALRFTFTGKESPLSQILRENGVAVSILQL